MISQQFSSFSNRFKFWFWCVSLKEKTQKNKFHQNIEFITTHPLRPCMFFRILLSRFCRKMFHTKDERKKRIVVFFSCCLLARVCVDVLVLFQYRCLWNRKLCVVWLSMQCVYITTKQIEANVLIRKRENKQNQYKHTNISTHPHMHTHAWFLCKCQEFTCSNFSKWASVVVCDLTCIPTVIISYIFYGWYCFRDTHHLRASQLYVSMYQLPLSGRSQNVCRFVYELRWELQKKVTFFFRKNYQFYGEIFLKNTELTRELCL